MRGCGASAVIKRTRSHTDLRGVDLADQRIERVIRLELDFKRRRAIDRVAYCAAFQVQISGSLSSALVCHYQCASATRRIDEGNAVTRVIALRRHIHR